MLTQTPYLGFRPRFIATTPAQVRQAMVALVNQDPNSRALAVVVLQALPAGQRSVRATH